jgi:dUTP pyrophosphatase
MTAARLLITRTHPDAQLPSYQTHGAAGMDLASVEEVVISPGYWELVDTGLEIAIPPGYEGQVRPRSGLAYKHGLTVLNAPGTIDSDYRGPVKVMLVNHDTEPFTVRVGDRIAQLVIAAVAQVHIVETAALGDTERGRKGFGSTGVATPPPPVDRSAAVLTTTGKAPEDERYRELKDNGQQQDYLVLSAEERAKGFVRPYRNTYRHVGCPPPKYPLRDLTPEEQQQHNGRGYVAYEEYPPEAGPVVGRFWTRQQLHGCGGNTTMGSALAETFARDPEFYGGTFCSCCGKHYPVGAEGEFVWLDGTRVGT